jgi:membrane protein
MARNGWERGLPMATIAESLRADPLQLEPVVDMLVEIDWISRLDEGAGEGVGARHVLLCDPGATSLLPLVNRTLMAPGEATAAFRERVALDQLMLADALGGMRAKLA